MRKSLVVAAVGAACLGRARLVRCQSALGRFVAAAILVAAVGTAVSASAAPNRGVQVPGSAAETASGDRWAVIGRGCVFARGKGFVRVTRGDTAIGSCIVKFNKDVTRCMYQSTIGLPGIVGVEDPGETNVVRRVSDASAVYVQTFASNGTLADRGFHLYVGCN